MTMTTETLYPQGVYDELEVSAVLDVLNSGSLAIGDNVKAMEERIAVLAGKKFGVMCNSGTSALFLAVELLDLQSGDEVITSPLTFSADIASLVRGGLVPVFVDIEYDTFNADASQIEELITDRTKAILLPDLAGGSPDWDIVRDISNRRGLKVIEDSCDALGATLRGIPTGQRADIWVTSFANAHIIGAGGNGGMVCVNQVAEYDRALMLRRWGRRHELLLFGSRKVDTPVGSRSFWSDLDGLEYDNLYIFDEMGWNFEPSEIGAAFGRVQLDKLPANFERRNEIFKDYSEALSRHLEAFTPPRMIDGLRTAWLAYPFLMRPEAGFTRSEFHTYLEALGIDTRTVWSGNMARQPIMQRYPFRQPEQGVPNADNVMRHGMVLPQSHALRPEQVKRVTDAIEDFAMARGL
jgi:CDP-6-deoxy-D-xylo-4-hexulose-3-dehydrase